MCVIQGCGEIRLYFTGAARDEPQFAAFCSRPLHGICRLTRTGVASNVAARPAQGRPLGLLTAWLLESHTCEARHGVGGHHAHRPTLEARTAARLYLQTLENGATLAAWERDRRAGEAEEPEGLA